MDDNSIMKFGKHRCVELANVPDDYLLHIYHNGTATGELRSYIENNLNVINLDREDDDSYMQQGLLFN